MKKIIGLAIAGVLLLALVAGGTIAYFADTETSSANVFTAGTLNLKTGGSDGVTATWTETEMAPGAAATAGTVALTNTGNLDAAHLTINFANALTNAITAAELLGIAGNDVADDVDMSDSLNVTVLSVGATNLLLQTTPGTFDNAAIEALSPADNVLTLKELDGATISLTTDIPAAGGAAVTFSMSVQLASATGNGNQGDEVETTVTFGLTQN